MANLVNKQTRDDLRALGVNGDQFTTAALADNIDQFPAPSQSIVVTQDQLGDAFNDQEDIDSRHEFFPGILQIPVAGPDGTPCVLVKVHSAYATRNVQFSVERANGKPRIPSPVPTSPNETNAYTSLVAAAPTLSPDGDHIYRWSGLYTFYLTSLYPGAPVGQSLAAGKLSIDLEPATYHSLDSAYFDPSIIPSV